MLPTRSWGAPKKLTPADIELVKEIWKHVGYICAQYLVAELPAWLDDYEKLLKHPIARAQRTRLEEVSYKTVEKN